LPYINVRDDIRNGAGSFAGNVRGRCPSNTSKKSSATSLEPDGRPYAGNGNRAIGNSRRRNKIDPDVAGTIPTLGPSATAAISPSQPRPIAKQCRHRERQPENEVVIFPGQLTRLCRLVVIAAPGLAIRRASSRRLIAPGG
jgi:hypothetical protein